MKKQEACLLCGAALRYQEAAQPMECAVCHRTFSSNARCENGHFICDDCHSAPGLIFIRQFCQSSGETDPVALADAMMTDKVIHLHGPEHHVLVGAALLTAYHNSGGELDLPAALEQMVQRGKQIPGGVCGFWGCCGAAVSAGIFAAIVTGSTPMGQESWGLSNQLTGACLQAIGRVGGPRCCKRDTYLSLLTAVRFCRERLGVSMTVKSPPRCAFASRNRECITNRCPFYQEPIQQEECI